MLFYAIFKLSKKKAHHSPIFITLTVVCSWITLYTQGMVWVNGEEDLPDWLFHLRGVSGSLIMPFLYLGVCKMIGRRLMTFSTVVLFLLVAINVVHYGVISLDDYEIDGYIDLFRIAFYIEGKERFNIYTFELPMMIQGIWIISRIIDFTMSIKERGLHLSHKSKIVLAEFLVIMPVIFVTICLPTNIWFDYTLPRYIYAATFNIFIAVYLYLVGQGYVLRAVLDHNEEPVCVDCCPKYSDMAEQFLELVDGERIYLTPSLKLEDVARMLGTNRTYVAEMVKGHFGQTFANLINERRIAVAKRILKNHPNYKLEEIAHESGFATAPTFTKVFKADTGLTPSAWIAEQQEKEESCCCCKEIG